MPKGLHCFSVWVGAGGRQGLHLALRVEHDSLSSVGPWELSTPNGLGGGQALPPDLQGENLAERMLALSQGWSSSVLLPFPSPTVRAISWVLLPLISCIPSCGCPSLKYVTLEQLKVIWGAPPMPPSPSPSLPSWASASQDLVPITCLPPTLPSSFASITPSSKVGGLCVLPTPATAAVTVCCPAH